MLRPSLRVGYVVINVKEAALGALEDEFGDFWIFQKDGMGISHNSESAPDPDLWQEVEQQKEAKGFFPLGGRLVSFIKDSGSGLVYISSYETSKVYTDIEQINGLFIILVVSCLCVGAYLSLYLAKNFYNPVKTAAETVVGFLENSQEKNELSILNQAISAVLNQKQEIERELRFARRPLEQIHLLSFLSGDAESVSPEKIGLEKGYFFQCILLKIDNFPGFSRKYSVEEQFYVKNIVLETVKQAKEGYQDIGVSGAILNEACIVLLFSGCHEEESEFTSDVGRILKATDKSIAELGVLSCTAGCSSIVTKWKTLIECYKEAQKTLQYTLVYGFVAVIEYEEIELMESGLLPEVSTEKLVNYLNIGDIQRARDLVLACATEVVAEKCFTNDEVLAVFLHLPPPLDENMPCLYRAILAMHRCRVPCMSIWQNAIVLASY